MIFTNYRILFAVVVYLFKYQLTKEEYHWVMFIKGKYSISKYVLDNTDTNLIMTFNSSDELGSVLDGDGMYCKAVMLSDDTALQRLFFGWQQGPEY